MWRQNQSVEATALLIIADSPTLRLWWGKLQASDIGTRDTSQP